VPSEPDPKTSPSSTMIGLKSLHNPEQSDYT
jgi:hypothetical protein